MFTTHCERVSRAQISTDTCKGATPPFGSRLNAARSVPAPTFALTRTNQVHPFTRVMIQPGTTCHEAARNDQLIVQAAHEVFLHNPAAPISDVWPGVLASASAPSTRATGARRSCCASSATTGCAASSRRLGLLSPTPATTAQCSVTTYGRGRRRHQLTHARPRRRLHSDLGDGRAR